MKSFQAQKTQTKKKSLRNIHCCLSKFDRPGNHRRRIRRPDPIAAAEAPRTSLSLSAPIRSNQKDANFISKRDKEQIWALGSGQAPVS